MEEARAAHPGVRFEYEGCGELVADFDHARIHQVLINLLNNAVQHGDAGSPVVLAVLRKRTACVSLFATKASLSRRKHFR